MVRLVVAVSSVCKLLRDIISWPREVNMQRNWTMKMATTAVLHRTWRLAPLWLAASCLAWLTACGGGAVSTSDATATDDAAADVATVDSTPGTDAAADSAEDSVDAALDVASDAITDQSDVQKADTPGSTETCNGLDDDLDGIVDNPSACWKTVYRFQAANGARCWGTSDKTPPVGCSGYTYEVEAFIVAATAVPNTFEGRQCSAGTDHIIVPFGSTDYDALVATGHDCSVSLGFFYKLGTAPASGHTPWANTCSLYRFSFSTPDGGAHLFTRGADSLTGMTCETPARADVFSNFACFSSKPDGC